MTINSPRTNGRLPGTGRTNGSGRFSFPERFLLQTIRRDGVVGARVGADARVRAAIPRLCLRHTTTRGTYRFEHPYDGQLQMECNDVMIIIINIIMTRERESIDMYIPGLTCVAGQSPPAKLSLVFKWQRSWS